LAVFGTAEALPKNIYEMTSSFIAKGFLPDEWAAAEADAWGISFAE